ncbi:hypothetical protein A2U01_0006210, partial [Trifolium medium]|nr:hypothetical protein [Trifolium medium]
PNYGRAVANNANVEESQDNDDVRSTKGTESFTFTKSQYEKLVNLLQSTTTAQNAGSSAQVNGASTSNLASTYVNPHSGNASIVYSCNNSSYGAWIIDSGASDHICSNLDLFDHHHTITPIQVKMPNGTIAYAKHAGSIKLGPGKEEFEDDWFG